VLSYAELLKRTDGPAGSAWGLHGENDEIGTLNFLTPQCAVAAAKLVVTGKSYNLDRALDAFKLPHRPPLKHVIHGSEKHNSRDDYVDNLYLQCSTQVDGLRHMRHPMHGFYNHTPAANIAPGTPRLGVQRFAEKAIVGRGVLLNVAGHLAKQGRGLDLKLCEAFSVDLLDEVATAQGVHFKPGDILMLRTGWLDGYFNRFGAEHMQKLSERVSAPGLIQARDPLAWLWDHQFSIIAADTPGFEAVPPAPDSPFAADVHGVPGVNSVMAKMMHPLLIPLLGFCLGELWDLEALARDCAADGRYECMITVKPLNLVGGVGSPANAMAIR
jgi:hypothetical protein